MKFTEKSLILFHEECHTQLVDVAVQVYVL